jgi:hypothetical protein
MFYQKTKANSTKKMASGRAVHLMLRSTGNKSECSLILAYALLIYALEHFNLEIIHSLAEKRGFRQAILTPVTTVQKFAPKLPNSLKKAIIRP